MGGSIRRRIVNPALLEERQKCNFDRDEAKKVIYPPDLLAEFKMWEDLVKKHPEIKTSFKYYEKTREEKFKEWWERLRVIMGDEEHRHLITNNSRKKCKYFSWYFMFAGTNPMTLHM